MIEAILLERDCSSEMKRTQQKLTRSRRNKLLQTVIIFVQFPSDTIRNLFQQAD